MDCPRFPAKAGTQSGLRSWAPAFGVPTKYYFAGGPFAGERSRS
jgi:hypothetical protein